MSRAPSTAQILSQANQLFGAGDPERAASLCRMALKQSPEDIRALHLLSACRMSLGDIEGAEDCLARAVRLAPREPDLHVGHGAMLLRLGRLDDSLAAVDRALALRPGDANACALASEALFRLRRFDEAAEKLDPFVRSNAEHIGVALSFALLCPRIGRHDDAIGMLRRCLDNPATPAPERMRALFAMSELYDGVGRYDEAFHAAQEAHALKRPRPDVKEYHESLEAMLRAWTPEAVAALPRASLSTELPVYIVGMPRSGTSLIEQILASHSKVHGGGERQDLGRVVAEVQAGRPGAPYHLRHLDSLNRKVVDRRARQVADSLRSLDLHAERITDKNPDNYLHLGLISILFPKARVIHCVRDPLDTGLSCYLNNIGRRGPVGFSVHAFADSLTDVGRWHRNYQRVMEHWRSVLDLNMLEVRYEDLVTDLEGGARRLVEFIGLPWEEDCLLFHENRRLVHTPSMDQVRRPVYGSAVGRWKNYEKHLGPLREALAGPGA